jgi:hypothetical protein
MPSSVEAPPEELELEDAWVTQIASHRDGAALSKKIDELLADNQYLVVVVSPPGTGKSHALLQSLKNWASHIGERSLLIDLLTPTFEVPTPAAVLQARRNSEARRSYLEEFGALTSSAVADLAGSTAANRPALANRWRKEERVFSVVLHDTVYYPGFQFAEDGKPLPVVAQVLAELDTKRRSDWEVALWFSKRSGWLDDRRPVDLLASDPEAVVAAAVRERDLVT